MRYRKKPIAVEAVQVAWVDMMYPTWLSLAISKGTVYWSGGKGKDGFYSIQTLEGVMTARIGDWIVQGVQGELYPVREDIFATTYEPAEDEVIPPPPKGEPLLLLPALVAAMVKSGDLDLVTAIRAGTEPMPMPPGYSTGFTHFRVQPLKVS